MVGGRRGRKCNKKKEEKHFFYTDTSACAFPFFSFFLVLCMQPTMGLTSNRRSPPSDVRPPPLTPIAPGMYPMNMMLPGNKYFMRPNESEWMAKKWSCVSKIAPRHLGPRPTHSGGYKGGNKGGGGGGHPPAGVAASATPR